MVPSMHPAFSAPHDTFSIKRLCHWIEVWPTNLPCRRDVPCDAGLDCRVTVCLGWVVPVEGDVGLGLALVCYAICLELAARLILMCLRLQETTKWVLENNKVGVRIIES
jgi:hypothetical protein